MFVNFKLSIFFIYVVSFVIVTNKIIDIYMIDILIFSFRKITKKRNFMKPTLMRMLLLM